MRVYVHIHTHNTSMHLQPHISTISFQLMYETIETKDQMGDNRRNTGENYEETTTDISSIQVALK